MWENTANAYGYEDKALEQQSAQSEYHQAQTDFYQPIRFQGQYFDQESGFHYNRFRYYCPKQQRFIHQDPIGIVGGINHYQYAPNPVNWVDPMGLSCKEGAAALALARVVPSSPVANLKPINVTKMTVQAAANDSAYVAEKTVMSRLLPFVAKAPTTLLLALHSSSTGGALEEIEAPNGTVYSKYGDETVFNAVGADGDTWSTYDPQEDIAYRTWLANGGDGSIDEWRSLGKPNDGNGLVKKATFPKNQAASFGESTSTDYKKTFFDAHPEAKGKVVVHHAVEQQVQRRYPNLVSDSELHSLKNLRGIPKEINGDVHLSKIRKEWNRFYRENPNATKQELLDKATDIDNKFGAQFMPPVRD